MGMDSVELVLGWEESLGVRIPDELVSQIRTPAQAIELVSTLASVSGNLGPSLIQRAFSQVRAVLMEHFGISRKAIRPKSRFSALLPKKGQAKHWRNFQELLGEQRFAKIIGWPIFGPSGTTIEDACIQMVALNGKSLLNSDSGWSVNQLREVVRCGVIFQVGVREFNDNDDFVQDLGID